MDKHLPNDLSTGIIKALLEDDLKQLKFYLNNLDVPVDLALKKIPDTPLHLARSAEAVKLLINRGANVAVRNSFQETPLHTAFNKQVVQALIKQGAKINAPVESNDYHWIRRIIPKCGLDTPLHRAKSSDVINAFLEYENINVLAKNNDGRYALEPILARYYLNYLDSANKSFSEMQSAIVNLVHRMEDASVILTSDKPALVILVALDDLLNAENNPVKFKRVTGFLLWLKVNCGIRFNTCLSAPYFHFFNVLEQNYKTRRSLNEFLDKPLTKTNTYMFLRHHLLACDSHQTIIKRLNSIELDSDESTILERFDLIKRYAAEFYSIDCSHSLNFLDDSHFDLLLNLIVDSYLQTKTFAYTLNEIISLVFALLKLYPELRFFGVVSQGKDDIESLIKYIEIGKKSNYANQLLFSRKNILQ